MMAYDDNYTGQKLNYRPNNKILLGLGVNHGFLGINIGFNFPFLNQDEEKHGQTKYYDFTLRTFTPKFNAMLYLQRYKGFYLRNTDLMIHGWEEGDPFYIRPDIRTYTVGLDLTYIFNNQRFSYRATMLQNEWQKKSAGSFLVGGSIIYHTTIADSSIVPSHLNPSYFFEGKDFDRSNIFSVGPIIGYAYTLVISEHFFVTASLNGSGNLGTTQLILPENTNKIKAGIILGFRIETLFSVGYNSERWYFGASYMNMSQTSQSPFPERNITFNTGIMRINIVRRFKTNKPIKILNPGS
jgi:hypothetical protein